MLIGKENAINGKLVKEISEIFPITFMDYQNLLNGYCEFEPDNPKVVIFNLMDIGAEEATILRLVKDKYPSVKTIALHCFQVDSLIQNTLARGFDFYISILNFSEEFQMILEDNPEFNLG